MMLTLYASSLQLPDFVAGVHAVSATPSRRPDVNKDCLCVAGAFSLQQTGISLKKLENWIQWRERAAGQSMR